MNKKEVQQLLRDLKPNETVSNEVFNELILFFSNHPCWDEKKGVGVKRIVKMKNEWNYSFYLQRLDDTYVSISVNFPKEINKYQLVLKALRNEIQPQIDSFRNTVNYGVDKCIFTNEVLTKENSHIDHYDLDFKDVAKKFISTISNDFDEVVDRIYKDLEKEGVKFYLGCNIMSSNWWDFHERYTNLRCITKKANLSRKKYE